MYPKSREREFRQQLRAIFGNSCYSDEVIDVIANVQLGIWGDKEIEEYRQRQRELQEQIKKELTNEPIPFEEQIIHSPAVFYHDNITETTGENGNEERNEKCETGTSGTTKD
jgi:hypothetical protein